MATTSQHEPRVIVSGRTAKIVKIDLTTARRMIRDAQARLRSRPKRDA